MTINEEALAIRLQYNGILTTASKVPLKDRHDLSVLYTPGVAEPCKLIKENKDLSFDYTCRGNMVAIISDGTRVLGLGDVGPEAAIPVMEGKAVLQVLRCQGGCQGLSFIQDEKNGTLVPFFFALDFCPFRFPERGSLR